MNFIRTRTLGAGLALTAGLSLTACSSSPTTAGMSAATAAASAQPATPSMSAPMPAATTAQTPSSSSATTASSAMAIAQAFIRDGLPARKVVAQTEANDPNKYLGRPGKYTQRVSFDLPGGSTTAATGETDRGAVIEWWPTHAGAQARADYIQSVLNASPALGTEYDYVHGGALLRITGDVVPSLAKQFQAALNRMP